MSGAGSLRLAVVLAPPTEASFVTIVTAARATAADGVTIIVPALDRDAAARRVATLVGPDAPIVVETVSDYLAAGHDHAALCGESAAALGRDVAATLEWLRQPHTHDGDVPEATPAEVVAWLAGHYRIDLPGEIGNETAAGPRTRPPAVPVDGGLLLMSTAWGSPFLAFAADRSLTPDLVSHGVYDPAFVRFLERSLHQGDTAIDIGANVGLFTVRMAQLVGPAGSVIGLEADPDIFAVLRQNVEMNYVAEWTRLEQVAAYSSVGTLTFHRTTRFRGNGSVVEKDHSYRAQHGSDHFEELEVAARPVDDIVEPDREVALVKIDVEGAELQVLEGMARTIDSGRVRRVAIEFVRETFGDQWEPLCARLDDYRRRLGASFATIDADGSTRHRSLQEAVEVGRFPQLLIDFGRGR